jgi:hypothetical protein
MIIIVEGSIMAREFEILSSDKIDWLFLDKYAGSIQYISYRHFIEHALHHFLRKYHNALKDSCSQRIKGFL